jgi:hypothetical protein
MYSATKKRPRYPVAPAMSTVFVILSLCVIALFIYFVIFLIVMGMGCVGLLKMINEKPIKQTAGRSASWKFVVVTISFSRVDDVVMSSRL